MNNRLSHKRTNALFLSVAFGTAVALASGVSPALSASLSQSIDVNAAPEKVWAAIGSFCAIKDWLPPVGACIEDGKTPPTRTLVTKDGKAAFVETQTARNDAEHSYSYMFVSSPLPVTNYISTIRVVSKREGVSTVTWSGSYTPEAGKEQDADTALRDVYNSGMTGIRSKLGK